MKIILILVALTYVTGKISTVTPYFLFLLKVICNCSSHVARTVFMGTAETFSLEKVIFTEWLLPNVWQ